MSDPAGWKWIEAWRNGTISDDDFAALQSLLREEPESRRTLRRFMAMDTALRDRAEAALLVATLETTSDESLASSIKVAPPRVRRRLFVAWSLAAACLLLSALALFTRSATNQGPPSIAESESPRSPSLGNDPGPAVVTVAQQREQLLGTAPDVVKLQLVSDQGGASPHAPEGDIVWSSGRQIGYVHLYGLPSKSLKQCQFQLWIVGSNASGNEIINGGTFYVDRNTGEFILPIRAEHFVDQPKMFLISVEPQGGGQALTAPLLAKVDGVRP